MAVRKPARSWVLLSYRLPREPSTPRITVWRKLERLGVARLGDGLVGLPADARTREQCEWLAEEVIAAGGSATVWIGAPTDATHEEAIVAVLREARAAEYDAITEQAGAAASADADEATRVLRRLREELLRVGRRDFFPPAQRQQAHTAVEALAAVLDGGGRSVRSR